MVKNLLQFLIIVPNDVPISTLIYLHIYLIKYPFGVISLPYSSNRCYQLLDPPLNIPRPTWNQKLLIQSYSLNSKTSPLVKLGSQEPPFGLKPPR